MPRNRTEPMLRQRANVAMGVPAKGHDDDDSSSSDSNNSGSRSHTRNKKSGQEPHHEEDEDPSEDEGGGLTPFQASLMCLAVINQVTAIQISTDIFYSVNSIMQMTTATLQSAIKTVNTQNYPLLPKDLQDDEALALLVWIGPAASWQLHALLMYVHVCLQCNTMVCIHSFCRDFESKSYWVSYCVELHSQNQRKDELVKPPLNVLTKLTQWTNWKESTLDSLELEHSCFVSRVPMRPLPL
jgi:hypothetical protein